MFMNKKWKAGAKGGIVGIAGQASVCYSKFIIILYFFSHLVYLHTQIKHKI